MFINSTNELFRLDLDVVKCMYSNVPINFHNFMKYFQVWEKCKNKSTRSLHGLTSILINDVCTLYFSNGANMLTCKAERIVIDSNIFCLIIYVEISSDQLILSNTQKILITSGLLWMIHFQHKSLENIIIHRKLHYAGHTKIVKIKIKSNRSYVSLIHAQTCV